MSRKTSLSSIPSPTRYGYVSNPSPTSSSFTTSSPLADRASPGYAKHTESSQSRRASIGNLQFSIDDVREIRQRDNDYDDESDQNDEARDYYRPGSPSAPLKRSTSNFSRPGNPHSHSQSQYGTNNGLGSRAPSETFSRNDSQSNFTRSYSNMNEASMGSRSKSYRERGDFCHVTVRLRPLNGLEVEANSYMAWNNDDELNKIDMTEEHVQRARRAPAEYYFDRALAGSDNRVVYQGSISHLVKKVMEGYHGTVFAYGQTASGKTYTMTGTAEQPGIIPQAIDDVFTYIKECPDREFLLRVSYLEIYNETLRDLLAPETPELKIHEDRKKGVYVAPLREEIVTSPTQVLQILHQGEQNRHFGCTEYNERSSRSHTIFQMVIESRDAYEAGAGNSGNGRLASARSRSASASAGKITLSQLNLIDLAGSEKATLDLERRKEGSYINKSLLTLGNVISRLTEEKPGHIPYRDSKLTRILQNSLSGNAKIAVVCTVSPAHLNAEETHNTLKFAARVKRVTLKAHLNEIVDEKALLQKYKHEIEELRQKLAETNQRLEQEKEAELRVFKEEKIRWEGEMKEQTSLREALKERIDQLTKLILTSNSINSKTLLEWESTPQGGNRNTTGDLDGLLPTSTSTSERAERNLVDMPAMPLITPTRSLPPHPVHQQTSERELPHYQRPLGRSSSFHRQTSDRELLNSSINKSPLSSTSSSNASHRAEVEALAKQVHVLEDTIRIIKSIDSSYVQNHIHELEQKIQRDYRSVSHLITEVDSLRKTNKELEIVLQESEEKIALLESARAKQHQNDTAMIHKTEEKSRSRLNELEQSVGHYKRTIEDMNTENDILRNTITDLRNQLRRVEANAADQEKHAKQTSMTILIKNAASSLDLNNNGRTSGSSSPRGPASRRNTVPSATAPLPFNQNDLATALPRQNSVKSLSGRSRQDSISKATYYDGPEMDRIRELEAMLELERSRRLEEQTEANERIAAIESELNIQKLELNVKHLERDIKPNAVKSRANSIYERNSVMGSQDLFEEF